MPLRFNQKELLVLANKPDENFDKLGVLLIRESEGKLFHKSEKFSERLLKLKGNLLFYLKTKDQSSEVVGLIVLDHSHVRVNPENKQFSFFIEFKDADEQSYELAAASEEEMQSWMMEIKNAGYQNLTERIAELRKAISEISGQDPLPDQEVMEPVDLESNMAAVITPHDSLQTAPPRIELCIALTDMTSLENSKNAFTVKVCTMSPLDNTWSNLCQTEICEDAVDPFFLKTVTIDQNFPISTKLKLTVCDVKNRSKNQVVALGQAYCSIQDIELSASCRLSLPVIGMESSDCICNMVIQGWKPTTSKTFAHRQTSIDFIRELGTVDDEFLARFPRTYVGQIVEKRFRFPTRSGGEIAYQELMGESLLSFKVPLQLLNIFVKEEKEAVLELHKLGNLNQRWENVKIKQQNIHFELVRMYCESMSDLSNYEGRNFKRSSEKCEKELEFLTTNLHLQRFRISDPNNEETCYDVITFGSPSAHTLKFRNGGLKRLLSSSDDSSRRLSINPNDSSAMKAGKKARNIKRILKQEKANILELCEQIASSNIRKIGDLIDAVSKKIAEILNLVSSSFVQEAEAHLSAARTPESEQQIRQSWKWTGSEFQDVIEEKDQDCGLRDSLANLMSLFNSIASSDGHSDGDYQTKMAAKAKDLSNAVQSFLLKFNVVMRFIIMCEEDCSNLNLRDIHYRRDIVLSQTIVPVIAGFILKLSENIENRFFLDQIAALGVLAVFECLITPHGDEMGMLEDAIVGFGDLRKVRFKFICNDDSEVFPQLEGDRCLFIVSIPLHKAHFMQLPNELRNGKLVDIHPVAFNIGINEHATIAERFGDMSLQENLNAASLNHLFSYFEKFSALYPDWVGTRSKSVVSLPMLMANLKLEVQSKKSKNTNIMCLSEEISLRMNGVRLTSCKSAKDRTAMAVTLEATRILEREHNLSPDIFTRVLSTIRSQGTRLINSFKNVGIPKYAFNSLQVRAYPSIYRAPEGTYGKNVLN